MMKIDKKKSFKKLKTDIGNLILNIQRTCSQKKLLQINTGTFSTEFQNMAPILLKFLSKYLRYMPP